MSDQLSITAIQNMSNEDLFKYIRFTPGVTPTPTTYVSAFDYDDTKFKKPSPIYYNVWSVDEDKEFTVDSSKKFVSSIYN